MLDLLDGCDHLIAGAALIGGITYFHTYAYDLLAQNERIIASTCDAAIKAHAQRRAAEGHLPAARRWSSSRRPTGRHVEGDERKVPPPLSSYGFQKLAVEYFAQAARDQYGLPYTILRPFNCVGIGESRALGDVEVLSGNVKLAMSHVVPDLVQKVLKGQDPLHLLGDGTQVRHYTYGGDLARGIVTAMEHPAALDDDFNLSTAESTTVLELAEVIWRKIKGPDVPFRYVSDTPFEHDVQKRVPRRRQGASACSASRPRPRSRTCWTRSSRGSSRRSQTAGSEEPARLAWRPPHPPEEWAPARSATSTASMRSRAQSRIAVSRNGFPPTRAVFGCGTRIVRTAGFTRVCG